MADEAGMAFRVAEKVAELGGRTFFVGGCVRDRLMNRPCSDIDIEVHGVTPEQLCAVLDSLGERRNTGAEFGIYGLTGCHLDIALPRREHATGTGHRDFKVETAPFIGPKEAAKRRDFTVNALMEDVLTGEIVDPYGGQADIRRGVLRHVDDQGFPEDPLRVLRGAQFAARLEFEVAPETLSLFSGMNLASLPRERVLCELSKALLSAERPSRFFRVLKEAGQLESWFPEVRALVGSRQDALFHPEGDVFVHTMQVVDAAARLRDRASNPLGFMLSALCHDFGKPATQEIINGHIHNFGHEMAGVPLAEAFLSRLTDEAELRRYVPNMVKLHMRPGALAFQGAREKAFMKLFDESVCPEDLILLAVADRQGSGTDPDVRVDTRLLEMEAAEYRRRMAMPYVTAQDLLDAGYKPGPMFREALAYAHKLLLSGVEKKDALGQTLAFAKRWTPESDSGHRNFEKQDISEAER